MSDESRIDIDQINLKRHLRLRAGGVKLDVHVGTDYIGAWMDDGTKPGRSTLGIYMHKGQQPYVMCYADENFGSPLPFAFGPGGLQVPHEDGTVTVLSLSDISEMVRALGKSFSDGRRAFARRPESAKPSAGLSTGTSLQSDESSIDAQ